MRMSYRPDDRPAVPMRRSAPSTTAMPFWVTMGTSVEPYTSVSRRLNRSSNGSQMSAGQGAPKPRRTGWSASSGRAGCFHSIMSRAPM